MDRDRHIRRLLWVTLLACTTLAMREPKTVAARQSVTLPFPFTARATARFEHFAIAPRQFLGLNLRQDLRDSIAELARAQVGKRYELGATTPQRGFDCSG